MVERNIRIVKSQEIIYLYCIRGGARETFTRRFEFAQRIWNNVHHHYHRHRSNRYRLIDRQLLARTLIEICQEKEREREIIRDYSYRAKCTRVHFFFDELLNPVTQLISYLLRHCCIIRFKNIYQTTEFWLKRSKWSRNLNYSRSRIILMSYL